MFRTLDSDCLKHGSTQARFRGHHLGEAPDALHIGVGALRLNDPPIADHVVGDDQRSGARQLQCPCEVIRVARLIGVDKDEVKGACAGRRENGKRVNGAPHVNIDAIQYPRVQQIRARHICMTRVDLQRDNAAAFGKRAGHADGAVSAQSSDFQNAPRAGAAHQNVEKLALKRGNVDGGKAGSPICRESGFELFIGRSQQITEIAVHLCPEVLHIGLHFD